jgi:hypothetical protein
MSRKNLKVSEVTHQALLAEQEEDESIDDTLRRILGVESDDEDVSKGIAAYLPEESREQVQELVDFIEELGDFEKETAEGEGSAGDDVMNFNSPGSGITIAQVGCTNDWYIVRYRDGEGELSRVFSSVSDPQKVDIDNLKEKTKQLVEGANRRWG